MKAKSRRRLYLSILALVLVAGCCVAGFFGPFSDYEEAESIHGWLPNYLREENRDQMFPLLYEKWESFKPSLFHRGEAFDAARIHVGCALLLWFPDKLSRSDIDEIHSEANNALKGNGEPGREGTGQRMIFTMANLINVKWKRIVNPEGKLTAEELDIWNKRGQYFATHKSPE